jgi:hypothetical protein
MLGEVNHRASLGCGRSCNFRRHNALPLRLPGANHSTASSDGQLAAAGRTPLTPRNPSLSAKTFRARELPLRAFSSNRRWPP